MAGDVWSWTLRPSPEAPSIARQLVRSCLAGAPATDVAELLVSELATNAVLHARTSAVLRIRRGDGRLRIELEDRSRADPVIVDQPSEDGGFGLRIVASLAESWGSERRAGGKVVWFELGDGGPPHRA